MTALALHTEDRDGVVIDIGRSADDAPSLRELADAINSDWRSSVTGILSAAQRLADAKHRLPGPRYRVLLSELHFGERTAQRLIAVGECALLVSATHASRLPASWNTLYLLAKLPEGQLAVAFERDLIHADLERKEIAELKRRTQRALGQRAPAKGKPPVARRPFAQTLSAMLGRETVAWIDGLDDRSRLQFIDEIARAVHLQKQAAERE